jgi:hypothetical protein
MPSAIKSTTIKTCTAEVNNINFGSQAYFSALKCKTYVPRKVNKQENLQE